jgi:AraC-like DNA-binding protein
MTGSAALWLWSRNTELVVLFLRDVIKPSGASIGRMRADMDTDLDFKRIVAESGYSRDHFLRMFQAATGCTPHQYFLRLRID